MAMSKAKTAPAAPEKLPFENGRCIEIWTVTGDGSATTVTVTPDMIGYIEGVIGAYDYYSVSGTTITLTWSTAVGNGNKQDLLVFGREW